MGSSSGEKFFAVLPAAGLSTRMGRAVPKPLIELRLPEGQRQTVLELCLERLFSCLRLEAVVVLHPKEFAQEFAFACRDLSELFPAQEAPVVKSQFK